MHTFPNLGAKLKESRVRCGLTRKQIAESLGISISVLGLYESGERVPSLPVLIKLANKYKVSLDYLTDNQPSRTGSISLDGLSDRQIKLLKDIIECFRG